MTKISKQIKKEEKIYLVGPRASGKTSVGKIVAKKLNYKFNDQDNLFHKKHGKIMDMIKNRGWKSFNHKLFSILKSLPKNKVVISGGGAIFINDIPDDIDIKKVNFCKKNGVIIFLAPSKLIKKGAKICYHRAHSRNSKILGKGLENETFAKFLKGYKIHMRYKEHSDIIVYGGKSPQHIADKVLCLLNSIWF